ncbi:MAG: redoxin domain-containing protein [Phycisphaerales bacterium]|nr:redoxin domain-containing protein [Phycisphaerales bacterium]
MVRYAAPLAALVVLSSALAALAQETHQTLGASSNLRPGASPQTPTRAPEEMRFAVVSMDGRSIRVPEDYRGKLVLVTFWATWCPHCREELPYWRKVHEQYREHNVEMIGLLQDSNRVDGTPEKAAAFLAEQKIGWTNVYEDAALLGEQFTAMAIPMSYLVDGDTGKVIAGMGSLRRERLEPVLVATAARKKLEAHRAAADSAAPAAVQPTASSGSEPAATQPVGGTSTSTKPAATRNGEFGDFAAPAVGKAGIEVEVQVRKGREEVYRLWTTPDGLKAFLGVESKVEMRIGGAYELYFAPDAPAGQRGAEGCRVLSYVPGRMLSFTWNAPPKFPVEREQRTWVVVEFIEMDEQRTRVRLSHMGFGEGGNWEDVRKYFAAAWPNVLGALARHCAEEAK